MGKKILLINNGYPSNAFPHKSTYIKSIYECLELAGIESHKMVLNSDFSSASGKIVQYLHFYMRLLCFRGYKKYDYVYIHHYPHVFMPLLFHFNQMKEIYINWHGEDVIAKGGTNKLLSKIAAFFLPKRSQHIVPSTYFMKELIKKSPQINIEKIMVSPSGGVDTSLFTKSPKNYREDNILHIGFASGIEYEKGIETLLDFIETCPLTLSCQFHIINYGREKERYIPRIKQHSNVTLHPPYKKKKMPDFYHKIDLLFFPTRRKSESLGLVALESMSCNVPVIGPKSFALAEIIQDGINGETYDPLIPGDYQKAFKRFLKNRNTYTPRTTIFKKYSKEYVVEQFRATFNG